MSPIEYAWSSFNENAKLFEGSSSSAKDRSRFHPTQKPVELYTWCLSNFASKGDLILDTHVGSASSLIACERLGFEYIGFEIDENYYKLAKARLDAERQQIKFDL